ncbi:MAG: hypothetical protein WDZ50_00205 [Woeseia sp.]
MQASQRPGMSGTVTALLLAALAVELRADDGLPPLFSDDAVLQLRIEAPLTTLIRERSDTEYLDGFVYYTDATGAEHRLDLKLRARGRYRRQLDTCPFPPVRLNFRKKQVEGTVFDGIDKLKLVTHCRNSSDAYEQNVLKEYLAYRIFNVLTDYSLRVRLLRIEYVDSAKSGKVETRYAFLIEDDELFADRIGASRAEVPYTDYEHLESSQASLVAVFQYLIGNTDFSMVAGAKDDNCCHNIELFTVGADRYLPVPYDFDFAGVVNARYAKPNPNLSIKRVTSRLYRGQCSFNSNLDDTVSQVMAQRDSVRDTIAGVPGMDERTRETTARYLDRFFEEMGNPRNVESRMVRKCL